MRVLCLVVYIMVAVPVAAQEGKAFRFLDLPSNARLTGLGGMLVSQPGRDVNLGSENPALSLDSLDGLLSTGLMLFPAGITKVKMTFQTQIAATGSWFISAEHIGYGDLESYDPAGEYLGDYSSGETMVMVGKHHRIGNFSLGGSVKFVGSGIGGYTASAMMIDIGGLFIHPEKNLSAGMVIRNAGFLLGDYEDASESELPFDVRAGVTFKPEFMPFRFSFTAFGLSTWENRETGQEMPGAAEEIFRHVNIGTEILLSRNVELLVGYNHGRRQELRIEEKGGSSGWSYGLLFRIKTFEFTYAYGGYHVAGGGHNFTLTMDTARWF